MPAGDHITSNSNSNQRSALAISISSSNSNNNSSCIMSAAQPPSPEYKACTLCTTACFFRAIRVRFRVYSQCCSSCCIRRQACYNVWKRQCSLTCSKTEKPFPNDLRSVSSTFSSPPNSYSANLSACIGTQQLLLLNNISKHDLSANASDREEERQHHKVMYKLHYSIC